MRNFYLLTFLLSLAACAPPPERASTPAVTEPTLVTPPAPLVETVATPVAAPPTATAVPTINAVSSPTERGPTTASPAPTVTPPAEATSGHTSEGAYYLGDPGAPVTIIDYSDFL